MRRVAEVIVVLRVLTSLFFLAPGSSALVGCAQICRAARIGADSAERYLALHVIRTTRRTGGWRATRPFKMLKLLLTLEALILKNGHTTSIPGATSTCKYIQFAGWEQSSVLLDARAVLRAGARPNAEKRWDQLKRRQ